jgi:hypothetical protein
MRRELMVRKAIETPGRRCKIEKQLKTGSGGFKTWFPN